MMHTHKLDRHQYGRHAVFNSQSSHTKTWLLESTLLSLVLSLRVR